MQINVLKSKLHRATVTGSNLDYEGSISIDAGLLERAGMHAYEKVDIYNINNGARFSTYIIEGAEGEFCLNGAAARMAQRGDRIIVASFTWIDEREAAGWLPRVVLLDEANRAVESGLKQIRGGTLIA